MEQQKTSSRWERCKSSLAYGLVGLLMVGATVFVGLGRGRALGLILVIDVVYLVVLGFQLYWNDCLAFWSQSREKEEKEDEG